MSTSNAAPPSSLAIAIARITMKHQALAAELARRTEALERRTRRGRVRTWRQTRIEILGHHE